ncbi:PepSY-associated TM helix domain-containing protein [Corynebacterium terpenotabidum]|uniref:PepSY domain-containing protein n=1 Tax=Corynebacterium terpenotabidum Y-11 TaxID=1200352 RepID=S4XFC8_9CORY|nr:PepSY domain-containing protein [Corynebacterium terpenotabidum]AGP31837.1 hypothetical protein A606_10990 [Corynebacterium terpenotabidum Y-11]
MTTTTQQPRPGARPASAAAPAPRPNRQTPRLLTRLHVFAGIFCAPFILVAAVTGLLYAVAPTVEQVAYHDMLTASATEEHPTAEPVSAQVATAQEKYPDLALAGIRLGDAEQTTRVLFTDPTLPESTLRAVFIDPYSGEVAGDSTQYGSSAALPLRQWLSEGHRMLWLGEGGRLYSELAASWLGVLAVGGVVVLWQRQRKGSAGSRMKGMLRRDGKGRTRMMRRHGATGTVVAVGLVFLTITGLTWSTFAGANISEVRANLHWTTPSVSTDLPGAQTTAAAGSTGHAGHADHATASMSPVRVSGLNAGSIDRVAATARQELRTPMTLTPPTAEGAAWSVTENRSSWRLANNAIAVDWATGKVSSRLDFADWPLAAQATAWMIQLHMGTLFGLPNQIVLFLLAAAIIVMVVRGYAMWWMRRPRGPQGQSRRNLLPASPPRAGWGRPTVGTLILGVALVVYGVIAPVFGVTCLAFILLSALWDLGRRGLARSAGAAGTVFPRG